MVVDKWLGEHKGRARSEESAGLPAHSRDYNFLSRTIGGRG